MWLNSKYIKKVKLKVGGQVLRLFLNKIIDRQISLLVKTFK